MGLLHKRSRQLVSAVVLFLCIFTVLTAKTHATSSSVATTPTTPAVASSYLFTAQPGDSLSRFVRRGLQLRTQLEPTAAVYCEDTIVRQHGAIRLEIGQQVELTFSELDNCALASQSLSAEQRAAWQTYASAVSFALDDIQPATDTGAPVSATSAVAPPADPSGDRATPAVADSAKPQSATKAAAPSAYWWYIGAGALVVVYFVLGGPLPKRSK